MKAIFSIQAILLLGLWSCAADEQKVNNRSKLTKMDKQVEEQSGDQNTQSFEPVFNEEKPSQGEPDASTPFNQSQLFGCSVAPVPVSSAHLGIRCYKNSSALHLGDAPEKESGIPSFPTPDTLPKFHLEQNDGSTVDLKAGPVVAQASIVSSAWEIQNLPLGQLKKDTAIVATFPDGSEEKTRIAKATEALSESEEQRQARLEEAKAQLAERIKTVEERLSQLQENKGTLESSKQSLTERLEQLEDLKENLSPESPNYADLESSIASTKASLESLASDQVNLEQVAIFLNQVLEYLTNRQSEL